jgi:hypothetical protein
MEAQVDPSMLIRHTGEFTVPQFSNQELLGGAAPAPVAPAAASSPTTCNWCGKREGDVRKLLSGPGVHICDGCVALCYMVLRDELPDFE